RMPHIFFFSYSRKDQDPYLEDFYKNLSAEVAGPTPFEANDSRVSFRDTTEIPLMTDWQARIEDSLQTSSVLVCVTSVKYLNSEFCGKEYYVFDQRRRQGLPAGQSPPPTILPVIWWPVGLPGMMKDVQQTPKG